MRLICFKKNNFAIISGLYHICLPCFATSSTELCSTTAEEMVTISPNRERERDRANLTNDLVKGRKYINFC